MFKFLSKLELNPILGNVWIFHEKDFSFCISFRKVSFLSIHSLTCLPINKSQPWSHTKFPTVYVSEILKQHLVVWQKCDLYSWRQGFSGWGKAFSPRFRDCQKLQVAITLLLLLYFSWATTIRSGTEPEDLRTLYYYKIVQRIFSTRSPTTKLSSWSLIFFSAAKECSELLCSPGTVDTSTERAKDRLQHCQS